MIREKKINADMDFHSTPGVMIIYAQADEHPGARHSVTGEQT